MTPSARVQAAIEILDEVIASATEDGPPADAIVSRYFKTRRYAGSKDRRAVRGLVFGAIRRSGERPASGRAAMVGLSIDEPELAPLFDGSAHGPEPISEDEQPAAASIIPEWLKAELTPQVTAGEWPALLERAPLDLRCNIAGTTCAAMLEAFAGAVPTPMSPWGIRLPADSKIDETPVF